jgi:hypothetical protein
VNDAGHDRLLYEPDSLGSLSREFGGGPYRSFCDADTTMMRDHDEAAMAFPAI